nr:MAG TPA_asm: hypothetical protein [Caudoviricetes sp.]
MSKRGWRSLVYCVVGCAVFWFLLWIFVHRAG